MSLTKIARVDANGTIINGNNNSTNGCSKLAKRKFDEQSLNNNIEIITDGDGLLQDDNEEEEDWRPVSGTR